MEQTQRVKFHSARYKLNRGAYTAQCTFEYFITLLVSDAFLAKLLAHMGLTDGMIGLVSSLISLSFVFQLAAIPLVQHLKSPKKASVMLSTLSQILFTCLYIIPFMSLGKNMNTGLVFTFLMAGYFVHYIILGTVFKWCNSFVDPDKRGKFTSIKEMVSLFSGMFFTVATGKAFDWFEKTGRINDGFLFIAITMIVLSILNFVSLLLVQDEPSFKTETKPFKEVVGSLFKNKNFVYVVIMTAIWDIARYFTIGFLGIFKTKELALTVGTVQIINIAASGCRMAISIPFGKFSDKHSYVNGMMLGYAIAALAFIANIFTTPATWWLIIVYTVLMSVSSAGTVANNFNIMYSYVPSQYYVQANAIKSSIAGLCGFGASFLGSKLLSAIQNSGNTIFGIHIYGQQLLSLISFVLIIALIILVKLTLSNKQVMKQ